MPDPFWKDVCYSEFVTQDCQMGWDGNKRMEPTLNMLSWLKSLGALALVKAIALHLYLLTSQEVLIECLLCTCVHCIALRSKKHINCKVFAI